MAKDQPVHVMISNPNEMRKTMLNSALQTTSLLRSYENYTALKKKEDKMKNELSSICNELKKLVYELKVGKLPKVHEEEFKVKRLDTAFDDEENLDYVSRLDRELQKIREKLNQL